MTHHASSRAGFSLVELTIVIAIMGLIAGGIVMGRSMIRQGELNKVATQLTQYVSAVQQFRSQYRSWPGDMPNATLVWGAIAGNSGDNWTLTCKATDSTGVAATCNGNGDQQIGGSLDHEMFRAWQHLTDAGLVGGRFSGVAGGGSSLHHIPGRNSPAGPLTNSGFTLRYYNAFAQIFNTDYGNYLMFGRANSSSVANSGIFTAEEAKSIDQKLDDGSPSQGLVQQYRSSTRANCLNAAPAGDDPATAVYDVTNTVAGCIIFYKL